MLIEFTVANFRSIREEQKLSFVASNYSEELPENLISCDHVPGLKGTKLLAAIALYGANASGKSNIVTALRFFADFVRDSATKLRPAAPTGVQPFKLDPRYATRSSKFEISAVIEGIRMLYGLELTHDRVVSEYLVGYPRGRAQVWFERDWDARKKKYKWSRSKRHFEDGAALKKRTRENAAFLSLAAQFNSKKAQQIYSWFSDHLHFLGSNPNFSIRSAARQILARSADTLTKILERADVGIGAVKPKSLGDSDRAADLLLAAAFPGAPDRELKLISEALRAGKLSEAEKNRLDQALANLPPLLELHHRGVDGKLVPLDFQAEESSGTRRYLEVMTELSLGAGTSRMLVTDEVEFSLHPLLLRDIISFCSFINTEHPKVGSQFLFTTHNPLLLDQTLIRRDQIWFTEKNSEGATRLYPLTDFKPRKDESLVKGYLAGRYGGIPFIPEALKL